MKNENGPVSKCLKNKETGVRKLGQNVVFARITVTLAEIEVIEVDHLGRCLGAHLGAAWALTWARPGRSAKMLFVRDCPRAAELDSARVP